MRIRGGSSQGLASLLAVVALAFAGPGCVPEADPPRNLIVVSIDTLRADGLGCYGNPRPTSPTIDELAAAGLLFEDASATSPWTKPSHASLLTGLFPSRNGATSMESSLREEVPHLASWLAGHGFETAAVVNSQWLASHGLERGFRHFEAVEYVQGRREGSPVSESAIRWLESRDREKRFLLMVHYMDVHSDYASMPRYEEMFVEAYDGEFTGETRQLYRVAEGALQPDAGDLRHLRNLYDAGVRQVDDQLGELIEYLRGEGLLEDSILVVTSDHGEEFFEHGGVIHGFTQFQEVIRIPLIFHGPGVAAGGRDANPSSLIDVMPTALELLDVPPPVGIDGVSLLGTTSMNDHRLLFYEADVTFPPPGPGPVPAGPHRAVRRGRFKFHLRTDVQGYLLYDLATDPAEQRDVAVDHPEVVAGLREILEDYLAEAPDSREREFSEEELDRLRSLGYVR